MKNTLAQKDCMKRYLQTNKGKLAQARSMQKYFAKKVLELESIIAQGQQNEKVATAEGAISVAAAGIVGAVFSRITGRLLSKTESIIIATAKTRVERGNTKL